MADALDPAAFNPHDLAFLADPYPTYAAFRDQAPIYRVNLVPFPTSPPWLSESDWMFRYDDCVQVLGDQKTWVKNRPDGTPPTPGPYGTMASSFPLSLFASDPPLHAQLRSILEPLFTGAIQTAPQLARGVADPLLARAREHGRMELIADYALPLPSDVLFTLLGIPDDLFIRGTLTTWAQAIAAAHDITQPLSLRAAGATCSMAASTYFEALLVANQTTPASGFFAEICNAFATAGLTPQEVQMCAVDFLVAGYLSTTFIIGTGVRNLLVNPDQLTLLRKTPSLIGRAVEEMLRFDGPVQVIDRYAACDTQVGDRVYHRNDKVTTVVGSADHDAGMFKNPERFRIRRTNSAKHLAFGDGIHYCIGAPLARLVAPVAIQMLLDAFPALALDGVAQWQTDPYLRAVTSLPLRF